MRIIKQSQLRLLDAIQLLPEVLHLEIRDSLGFEDLLLQVCVFLLQQLYGVLVVVLHLDVLC